MIEILLKLVVHLFAFLAAMCLTIYWAAVIFKLIRLARKIGKDPNAVPREPVGQVMRILWYPCIFVLITALWVQVWGLYGSLGMGWLTGPLWWERGSFPPLWWWPAALVSGVLLVICTAFTFVCWRKMGRSWRIGIDPGETLELVSTGPYKKVRHPIYALRMVINICAFILAPSMLVGMAAGIDFLLLQIEARREETYMVSTHGDVYRKYQKSVGRFIPRLFV